MAIFSHTETETSGPLCGCDNLDGALRLASELSCAQLITLSREDAEAFLLLLGFKTGDGGNGVFRAVVLFVLLAVPSSAMQPSGPSPSSIVGLTMELSRLGTGSGSGSSMSAIRCKSAFSDSALDALAVVTVSRTEGSCWTVVLRTPAELFRHIDCRVWGRVCRFVSLSCSPSFNTEV